MNRIFYISVIFTILMYGCFPKPTNYNGKYPPRIAAEKNLQLAKKAIERIKAEFPNDSI